MEYTGSRRAGSDHTSPESFGDQKTKPLQVPSRGVRVVTEGGRVATGRRRLSTRLTSMGLGG